MADRGPFFLAICSALLVAVGALQCYTKIEVDCTPSGPICDSLAPPSSNVPMTITSCDSDVTMCSLYTVGEEAQGFYFELAVASCLTEEEGATYTNGCYGRNDLEKMYPNEAEKLKELEKLEGITFSTVEVCVCDGNLCNGSIKSVLSISVIITSVIMSLMLFT